MTDPNIRDLVSRYFEGVSSDDETAILIRLLSKEAAHRRLFLREAMLRAELHEWANQQLHQGQNKDLNEDAGTTVNVPVSRWRSWRVWAPMAATLAVLAGSYGVFQWRSDKTTAAQSVHVVGSVQMILGAKSDNAVAGRRVQPGAELVSLGANSGAVLAFRDETTITIAGDTRIRLLPGTGKRVHVNQGRVTANVSKQPDGRPMVFSTPHAQATVLGTELALAVETAATRLDVIEGRVKFTRLNTPVSWDVSSGGYVLAGPGITLSANARRSGPDEALRVIEDHEGPLAWRQLPECAPLAFAVSPLARSGRNGLRVVYEPKADDRWSYGEIAHPFVLKPGDRTVRFSINVERYEGNANWTIQFRQRDRNCWMIATGMFADLGKGWNRVELEIPRTPENVSGGGGTYRPDEVQELLFAVCLRAAACTVDDFAVGGGERP